MLTTAEKYGATVVDAPSEKVVGIIRDKNIVALWQGKSENGPKSTW